MAKSRCGDTDRAGELCGVGRWAAEMHDRAMLMQGLSDALYLANSCYWLLPRDTRQQVDASAETTTRMDRLRRLMVIWA